MYIKHVEIINNEAWIIRNYRYVGDVSSLVASNDDPDDMPGYNTAFIRVFSVKFKFFKVCLSVATANRRALKAAKRGGVPQPLDPALFPDGFGGGD
jgi:hypothetical protein